MLVSLCKRISWSTESKALARSMKAAMQTCLLSMVVMMSSRTFRVAVMHPWPVLNPDCRSVKIWLESMKWVSCLWTNLSKDFGQARQDGYRPVAVGVRARASFEKREDHGRFPIRRENRQCMFPGLIFHLQQTVSLIVTTKRLIDRQTSLYLYWAISITVIYHLCCPI